MAGKGGDIMQRLISSLLWLIIVASLGYALWQRAVEALLRVAPWLLLITR